MQMNTPDTIYLIPDSEHGFVWCDVPAPTEHQKESEAVKYTKSIGWISVEDRMPDESEPVVYLRRRNGKNCVGIAYWSVSEKWNPEACSIANPNGFTHWMPLPELPKGIKK